MNLRKKQYLKHHLNRGEQRLDQIIINKMEMELCQEPQILPLYYFVLLVR